MLLLLEVLVVVLDPILVEQEDYLLIICTSTSLRINFHRCLGLEPFGPVEPI